MTGWTPTTRMRCAVCCDHLQKGVDDGYGIDTVRGDANHPVSRGLACQRGIDEGADPDGEWLTRPLIRKDGNLVATSWDMALGIVTKRFESALDRTNHGVAVLGSGQQTNFLDGPPSPRPFSPTRACQRD